MSNHKNKEIMNCNQCHTSLMGYLEGTLPENLATEVGKHLNGCTECAGFEAFLRDSLHLLDEEKHLMPPPFLYTRIKRRMTAEKQQFQDFRLHNYLQPAVISLLLLAGIFTGVLVGQYLSYRPKKDFISESLTPLVDEMMSEPLELFLLKDN